jgi:hypothetical protein
LSPGKTEPNFVKKNTSVLAGSQLFLLSDETIRKFICYTPKNGTAAENFRIGLYFFHSFDCLMALNNEYYLVGSFPLFVPIHPVFTSSIQPVT